MEIVVGWTRQSDRLVVCPTDRKQNIYRRQADRQEHRQTDKQADILADRHLNPEASSAAGF